MKKIISILMISVLFLVGCGSADSKKEEAKTRIVKDLLGREVEIPKEVKTAIAVGAGSLRIVSYMESTDKIIGVEEIEKESTIGRPYSVAYPELSKLPFVGKGGGGGVVTYNEEILKLKPDVIIATYDNKLAEDLQNKTGIPVVAIGYKGIFDENMDKSLGILGEVFDKKDRATELVEYMNKVEEDLNSRTKDIKDADKKTVYTGAVSFNGQHGFDGSYGKYPPFDAINAKNVVDETGKEGALIVDLEKVIEWNPEIIFLNPDSMKLVNEQYAKNKKILDSLDAVKKGEIYSQPSYNWYTTNVEIAIADAYYAGKIIYPEQFKDINIEEKSDEIFEKMLGKKLYSELEKANMGFGKLKIGE